MAMTKEQKAAYFAKYRKENKEAKKAYNAKWRAENKDYDAKYREENKEARNAYEKSRSKSDPIFKTARLLRNRTWAILKNKKFSRSQSSSEYLGCSFEQLKTHLEAQFQPGMTWENQGQWHVDHIISLASAKTIEEVYALCHYSNLQPLWAAENISKGAKVPDRY